MIVPKQVKIEYTKELLTPAYGSQEGAAIGYNPHKLGAPSYHPLLLFHSNTKEVLLGKLRAGDTYTGNGSLEALQELASQFPKKMIRGRFDSGFFDGKTMDWMDTQKHEYLIKVKFKGLKERLQSLEWTDVPGQPDCECSIFWHNAESWEYERLLQVVRIKKNSEEAVSDTEDSYYAYFCYACNYELDPWAVHKEYGKRATSENWIQEAKKQMGICSIKTKLFWANATSFKRW
jgi:Transposase DDE domain group 1